MVDILKDFVVLEEPCGMGGMGWYVGCADIQYEEYYLHNDGVIYGTCAPRFNGSGDQLSTGWFNSEVEAYMQIRLYYTDNAPDADVNDKAESQVMEFE